MSKGNAVHSRAKVCIEKPEEAERFVKMLNSDGSADKYVLENFDSSLRIEARSLLGVIYASVEWAGETYLVNLTHDNVYPSGLRDFYM